MVTMVDEIFDRHYQAGRNELNATLAGLIERLGNTIGESFRVLHRIEWSAPWNSPSQSVRRG